MISLVIGGADSGKSEYAERLLISESGEGIRIYLATMKRSEAASEKIARHVRRRAGSGFATIECDGYLEGVRLSQDAFVLFEDLPNYVANIMFDEDAADMDVTSLEKRIFKDIDDFLEGCKNVVFVTGDIASSGSDYGKLTMEYMKLLGHVQQHIAKKADRVTEVVAGQTIKIK